MVQNYNNLLGNGWIENATILIFDNKFLSLFNNNSIILNLDHYIVLNQKRDSLFYRMLHFILDKILKSPTNHFIQLNPYYLQFA